MARLRQSRLSSTTYRVLMTALFTLTLFTAAAQAQTLTVLHNFTGGSDGSYPTAGVTFDQQGRIYGTASSDGSHDGGVLYRLVHQGEGWTLSRIYSFGKQGDGSDDLGEIFRLTPSGDQWLYSPYYQFTSSGSGAEPTGAVIFDASGNMYGTAFVFGTGGEGGVGDHAVSGLSFREILYPHWRKGESAWQRGRDS